MASLDGITDMIGFQAAKALAAVEQPRPIANQHSRRVVPHAEPCRQIQSFLLEKLPLECRLLVWKEVLQVPYTGIGRWQRPYYSLVDGKSCSVYGEASLNADCFPYRLSTPDNHSKMKQEKPVALLLSCRQIYSEALKVLYSSTSFVFAVPTDIHCFQLIASPEGLAYMKSMIIAFGNVDWQNNSPFHQEDGLREWEETFHNLKKMPSLRELQIWFYHGGPGHVEERVSGWARRPWQKKVGSEAVEERHKRLFDVFSTAKVPKFTVYLTWNPGDLLEKREWRFKVSLQTYGEVYCGMSKFPYSVDSDLYD